MGINNRYLFKQYKQLKRKYKLSKLGKIQLKRLRSDICLCSLYYDDYNNRYNLDVHTVCNFFDGYADYLSELMEAAGVNVNTDYFINLEKYDNIENLYNYYCDIEFYDEV